MVAMVTTVKTTNKISGSQPNKVLLLSPIELSLIGQFFWKAPLKAGSW